MLDTANSPRLTFGQAWRDHPQAELQPGWVRVGHDGEDVWVAAELCDDQPSNAARGLNQETFQLGDVFEIFVRPEAQESYHEIHITPENQYLQLRWPSTDHFGRAGHFTQFFVTDPLLISKTWVESRRWRILASLRGREVSESRLEEGQNWLLSFSRYDYQPGRAAPVLSSCSPHSKPNYHRAHEWTRFVLG